jgi:hypothetical protein
VPLGKVKNHCPVQRLAEFSISVASSLQHCFAAAENVLVSYVRLKAMGLVASACKINIMKALSK